jgi:hypothetical protein
MRGRATDEFSGRATEATRAYSTSDRPDTDADVERRTTEIRRDIEQTREEMSETIDAIQEKLRPGNIVSGATERVKNATTEGVRHMAQSAEHAYDRMRSGSHGDSGGGFTDHIRENPVPAMLIGMGAAWLLMNRSKGDYVARGMSKGGRWSPDYAAGRGLDDGAGSDWASGAYYGESGTRFADDSGRYGSGVRNGGRLMDRVQHNPVPAALAAVGLGWLAMSSMRENESEAYYTRRTGYDDSTSSMTSQVRDSVASATSHVAESARNLTTRAQEYASQASGQGSGRRRSGQSQLQRMTRENPLLVGAGALLVGAAVGLSLPETERENELLGDARDSMIDRAQQMARTAASQAQETAAEIAGETASRLVSGKQE